MHPETFGGAMAKYQIDGPTHLSEMIIVVYQPPFRSKDLRITSKDLMELCAPCIQTNECATWNVMTADDVSFNGYNSLPQLTNRGEFSETL